MTSQLERAAAQLASIKPVELSAYLRATGWSEKVLRSGWAVWVLGDDFEVTLPLRTDFRDYVNRIADAIRTLERAEDREAPFILQDIQATTTDIIRVRINDHDAANGTLPIDKATELIARSREMILAGNR
jgi:hypothetical protein